VLAAALTMLEGCGFIDRRDGLYRVGGESEDALKYYANSISQWQT